MEQLSQFAPARVLQLLRGAYVSRRSGHLHLTSGPARRGLTLRDGQIVHGRSDVPGERLRDVLVRHGLVSEADLDRAVETMLAERRPLGAILAEIGLIDPARLEEAVGWHVREILFAALDEPGGSSSFEELESLPEDRGEGDPASRLSTGHVLLEAARRLPDPAIVHEALGDVDRKLVLATDPRLRVHPVALTPTDGFVLSRVDGTLSARELIGLIPLPPEDTERSLLGLLCTGAVDFAPDRPPSRRAPVRSTLASPPSQSPRPTDVAPPPADTAPSVTLGPASAPPAAPAGAPAEPSASPPGSSLEEVRHLILDMHESLLQRDNFELLGITPEASAVELRAAYVRLARVLHPDACRDAALADVSEQREEVFFRVCLAYETLSEPEARAAYQQDLRRRKPGPVPAVPVPSGSAEAPSAPTRAPVPPAGPEPPDLSRDERLAETIATGEELLRDGQYWEAIQRIEPTLRQVQGELRVRARLALARACLKNPKWIKRAEAHLQEVLHEDPALTEAYLLLGDIYRNGQLPARAAAMYRKALDQKPSNRHALRELARLESAEPPPGGGSLLGFLKRR